MIEEAYPFIHTAVDMQGHYLRDAPRKLPGNVNRFAHDLHMRGVPTIWVATVDEAVPTSFHIIDMKQVKALGRTFGMVWAPNPGDMFATKHGRSALTNTMLRDYLFSMLPEPQMIPSGVFASRCITSTVGHLASDDMFSHVPLDLIADINHPRRRYLSAAFFEHNEAVIAEAAKRGGPNHVSTSSSEYVLTTLLRDMPPVGRQQHNAPERPQEKRPTPKGSASHSSQLG